MLQTIEKIDTMNTQNTETANKPVSHILTMEEYKQQQIQLQTESENKEPKKQKVKGSGKKKGTHNTTEPIRNPEHLKAFRSYFYDKYTKTDNIGMKQKHLRNYLIFIVGLNTGLRISDIMRLSWQELLSQEKFFIKEKKTKKWNSKYITEDIRNAVTEYYTFCQNNSYDISPDYALFIGKSKRDITEDDPDCERASKAYIKVLKETAAKIGINTAEINIGTHTLRKTFCYWYLNTHKNNNYALLEVQQMLKHDKQSTTLLYAGISQDNIKKNTADVSSFYKSVDSGSFSVCDDEISVSESKIKELLKYAYCLGKESLSSLEKDLENIETLSEMFEEMKL